MKRKHAPKLILEAERTRTLVNHHFDDLYGVALNLPNVPSCKEGRKSSLFKLSFLMSCWEEEVFYDGFRQRLIFFEIFFVNFETHCVLVSLFLPFNKFVTPARLALSHRQTKML